MAKDTASGLASSAKQQATAQAQSAVASAKQQATAQAQSAVASAKQQATAQAQAAVATATAKVTEKAQEAVGSATQAVVSKAQSVASSAQKEIIEKAQNAAITTALKQVPGGAALVSVYNSIKDIGRRAIAYYQTLPQEYKFIFIAVLVIAVLVTAYFIYAGNQKKTKEQIISETAKQVSDNAATLGQLKAGLDAVGITNAVVEGFQDCPTQTVAKKDEIKLISLQPFSIKQAGFKGTANGDTVTGGAFDEADAVRKSLQAGVRTFVLQIDYLETVRPAPFPAVNEPCLLYKNAAGELISSNSGSIQRVCQTLADNAFAATLPQKDDPILIILYLVRTPVSVVANARGYIQYLSKIASQLAPLTTRHLGLTDNGDFHKQALEKDILTLPFTTFQRKFIVATNADTSAFRRQEALQVTIETQNNLDFWSNMRLYKTDANASLGLTEVHPSGSPNFVVVSENQMTTALTTSEKTKALSDTLKGKFSMYLPSSVTNPSTTDVDKMLDQIGINVIPLDIFSFSTNATLASSLPWKTNTWKLKPGLLR